MKTRRKRYFASCTVFLLFCMMFMPLTALAEGTEIPKGYVDPVSTLDMKRGDVNVFGEFWDRLEEIYLVPYEAHVVHFDSYLFRAEDRRFHPVSGAPLVIKRGEVIPEYRIDISYGPVEFATGKSISRGECSGEYVMKNIQFGNTESKSILYNAGGSCVVTTSLGDTSPQTSSFNIIESRDYGNKYHLPEASYAGACTIDSDDPTTLILFAIGDRESQDGSPMRAIQVNFRVAGAKLSKGSIAAADKEAATVDTHADKDAGETSTSIPGVLATVIIGGIAAIAGAGTGGSGDGGDNRRKKKSRYKMCLRKDFGDAIRYGTQPVTVYARMVEVTPEGEEMDRLDLTASLEIFSGENLSVEGSVMADNYMGALVSARSVPGGQNPDSGIVSIRFSGEGGSFQNNVTFRLIGKPYISFPEQGNYLTMTLPMLLGDGEIYEIPFVLNDFLEKPASVKPEVAAGVLLSCEIEELEESQYILKVKNNSSKPEVHQTVKQTFSIGIRAENEMEKAENSLNVELYPEGLSIREVKFDEKGYALIETFDNESTEEWGDVLPTGFVLDFVVPEDQQGRRMVRVLAPEEFSPVFAGLKGTDERTTHLAERFKYIIEEIVSNLKEYKFAPQEALVEAEGKPYYLTLPISCTYGDQEYILDLPVRLLGGGPGPMEGWDEEFAKMKRIVSRVGGISPEIAWMLRENGKKMSTAELRLVDKRICQDAIVYYTQDASEYEKIAAELDDMIYYADWLKWFGDQAFSYLISTYYGSTADAIFSPAKDIFASLLGETIGILAYGEQFDIETLEVDKNINAAFDNLTTNAFDDKMGKGVSYKQVCAVVGGFLVWKIAKNIYDNMDKDGKVDLYSAITATTADLTAMGMKKIAGNFFDKALKNKVVQENLNTPLGKWLQNIVPDTTLVKWSKDSTGKDIFKMIDFNKSDIFQKYLEEFFGMGMVKVTEIDMAAVKGLHELTSGSSIESTIDLSAWPQIDWTTVMTEQNGQQEAYKISVNLMPESLGKLYDYLFRELFSEVPFAKEEKQPPVDPPYKREGSPA